MIRVKIRDYYDDNNIDCNKYLYHYTSLSTGMEHILNNGTLRLSPFSKVNDPKESKERFIVIRYSSVMRPFSENEKIRNRANKILMNCSKAICFSCDNTRLNTISKDEKIFYRGYCKPRMWAQYGENHRGMCLVFDKKKLINSVKNYTIGKGNLFSGKVQYKNNSKEMDAFNFDYSLIDKFGLEDYLFRFHFDKYKKEVFFSKLLDWRDEQEFRIVLVNNEDGYLDVPFQDSLASICIGANFPKVFITSLINITDKYNVNLKRIRWMNGVPEVYDIGKT